MAEEGQSQHKSRQEWVLCALCLKPDLNILYIASSLPSAAPSVSLCFSTFMNTSFFSVFVGYLIVPPTGTHTHRLQMKRKHIQMLPYSLGVIFLVLCRSVLREERDTAK